MIKVAHITEAFCGGVLTYLRTMLPALARCGCRVSLICSLERDWPALPEAVAELRHAGVAVHVVRMSRGISAWDDARSLVGLTRVLSEGQFDVVHTHASKAGVLGALAARLAGVPRVAHSPHCFAFLRCRGSGRRWAYRGIERAMGLLRDLLVGVSREEAAIAASLRIVPRERCAWLDNALADLPGHAAAASEVRRRQVRRDLGIPDGAHVVTTVGRLVAYKGVAQFVEAAALGNRQDTVFLVVGDGPARGEIERLAHRRGLDGRLRLLGRRDGVEDIYAASDLVVSCSQAEGQPYALLEAMRAGRAILATDVPGHRDLLRHGRTGWLVGFDGPSIAEGIDHILADDDLRSHLGQAARGEFLSRPTPQDQARRLAKLCADALAAKGS